jgi:ADP-ribosyl-[dinitrogen reductase] hydrolase
LKWWLAALPAGVGLSTARAIGKLWLGYRSDGAGVRSAGNGAAMRSAIIGVTFPNDREMRHRMALAACRVTHVDPRAEESALLVTEAAALATTHASRSVILETLRSLITSPEMQERFTKLDSALGIEATVPDYAAQIGCAKGVTGFAPNTVAVALYAWLRHRGDFEKTLTETIRCGGDTDSVAAIAGAICGTEVGEEGIPEAWITGICDWPRSIAYLRRMADPTSPVSTLFWPASLIRNLVFLIIVLLHGLRRLLPPY